MNSNEDGPEGTQCPGIAGVSAGSGVSGASAVEKRTSSGMLDGTSVEPLAGDTPVNANGVLTRVLS